MSETYFAVVFECRSYLKWFYSIYTLPHKTETASCFKKNAKKKTPKSHVFGGEIG